MAEKESSVGVWVMGAAVLSIAIGLLVSKKTQAGNGEEPNGNGEEPGGTCQILVPGVRYEFFYTGPRIKVKKLLGECYPVVYYLEIYDEDTQDWIQPLPETDYVETNSQLAVMVQASCTMCGF